MKAFNGIGIVIAVILAFILLIPKPADGTSATGLSDVQYLFRFLIPLPVLMILSYKRILMEPSERKLHVAKGIWPIIVKQEISFEDTAEIQFDAMRGRYTVAYSAYLCPIGNKKPILLFADGDEDQFRTVLDFTRSSDLKVAARKGLQKFASQKVRELMPEIAEN